MMAGWREPANEQTETRRREKGKEEAQHKEDKLRV